MPKEALLSQLSPAVAECSKGGNPDIIQNIKAASVTNDEPSDDEEERLAIDGEAVLARGRGNNDSAAVLKADSERMFR